MVLALTSVESYRHQTTHAGAGHWTPPGVLHTSDHALARTLGMAQESDAVTTITIRPLHNPAPPPPAVVDLRPRPAPSLDEQLHTARTQLTATQSSVLADQLARSLGELIDAGHAVGPGYGPVLVDRDGSTDE